MWKRFSLNNMSYHDRQLDLFSNLYYNIIIINNILRRMICQQK